MSIKDFLKRDDPYFIAEIGINHNGDMQIVKRLIDAAFACQWDCVKFQKRDPDTCIPEYQKDIRKITPWGEMSYLEYKKKIELDKDAYDYIDKYCKEKPIQWTASVWDLASLDFLLQYDTEFLKIPSAKLTDYALLIESCKSKRTIILSTGMSTLDEIDQAVEIMKRYGSEFILMHCNSAYPTPIDELNIQCIHTLKERYQCPIGYSGHEPDLEPTVFAAVLGAKVIERHITIDHSLWGTDQVASLEVVGMDVLRKRVKDIHRILGDGKKTITPSELPILKKLRGIIEI